MTPDDQWRQPSQCADASCAQWIRWPNGTVSVRSSTGPAETVTFTKQEWAALVVAVKAGETDE